jgi:ABC-2 type transport system permease protein
MPADERPRPDRRRPQGSRRRPRPGPARATIPVTPVTPIEPTLEELEPEILADAGERLASPPSEAPEPALRDVAARPTAYDRLWDTGLLNVAAITRRELAAIFVSPIFYVVAAVLAMLVTALSYLPNLAAQQPFTMGQIFALVETLMVFVAPLITMRLLAEERRTGTLEILLTSPVRDWEVVAGKWLGGLITYLAAIAFTVVYVVLISIQQSTTTGYDLLGLHLTLPNVDYGGIVAGYLGALLVGGAWIAIGLLASSLTSNQIVAAVVGVGLLMVLYLAFAFLPVPQPFSDFLAYFNASAHAQSFHGGRLALSDIVYFLTLIVAPLFLATRVLESRRWR